MAEFDYLESIFQSIWFYHSKNADIPSGSELAERDFDTDKKFWCWRQVSVFSLTEKSCSKKKLPFWNTTSEKKEGLWSENCIKPSERNGNLNNWSDLGSNSKVHLTMCNEILAWSCPKTQGTAVEIMATVMGTVMSWAAGFAEVRGSPTFINRRLHFGLWKNPW